MPKIFESISDDLQKIATTAEAPDYSLMRSSYMKVGSPRLVLRPRNDSEVSLALRESLRLRKDYGLPFSVRSGGHGISGQSTNEGGIILDMSHLRQIDIASDGSVSVAAGAVWAEVASKIEPHQLVLSSGNFGGSGVGGLISAGGVGYMLRAHGLTIDHLLTATVALASGEIVEASASQNSDLFWSLRGGAGQTGVVLRYLLQPHKLKDGAVIQQSTLHEVRSLGDYVEAWGAFMRSAPREFTSFLTVQAQSGLFYVSAVNVWAGSDANRAMDYLQAFSELADLVDHEAAIRPYSSVILGGRHPNTGQQTIKMRDSMIDRADRALGQALSQVLLHQTTALVELRSMGGAVSDVAIGESAFAHRSQEALVAGWFYPAESSALDAIWQPVAKLTTGIYSLYTSDTSPKAAALAWPGETGKRLKALAERFDPEGLFTDGISLRR